MIFCNGAPKSGTHLLMKAVHLFGYTFCGDKFHPEGLDVALPETSMGQIIHTHAWPNSGITDKHILIVRNPRNVVTSYSRAQHISLNQSMLHNLIDLPHYSKRDNCLVIRFEQLLTDPDVLIKLSEYLEKPLVENHFKKLWGATQTFTNQLSNWREDWNDDDLAFWLSSGGTKIETMFGYDPENERYIRCPVQ